MNMIFNARIYYRRLTTWTRAYLIGRYFGIGTAEELFSRLYLESLDVGSMLELIFGHEYSNRYSQLLSQFPIALRELVSAQLEGNPEAVRQNIDRLYLNVNQRAEFLEEMNPYWNKDVYHDLFDSYIQHTLEGANAISSRDLKKFIEINDELAELTDMMGDTFAQGIYEYVTSGMPAPELPPEQCITYEEMNEVFNIRMFWFELVTWVRIYMLSRYSGICNEQEALANLKKVPADYINSLKRIFGDRVPANYPQLFEQYIDLIDALITAQMQGNTDEINRITRQLYQNADERAAAITSVNPEFWKEDEWRTGLENNLRTTIDESTALLAGDYTKSIDILQTLLDQAEGTSNYFAQGLFNYLNFK
jgi:hypothetical protein